MKRSLVALAFSLGAAGSAVAGPAAEQAQLHFQAIGAGDTAQIAKDYGDDSRLNWIGGPLDGTYIGTSQISGIWDKLTKSQGPLKVSVGSLQESINPKGSTVTANVQFDGKQPIKVRYVLTYREGRLVNETWQIDPKLEVSRY